MGQNELTSKKHPKVSTILNYVEHSLILASVITGCLFLLLYLVFL